MAFYHCTSSLLEVGSILYPGNWGRIIRNAGWQHNQAFKEAALEYVRTVAFPTKPSRLESAFFFDDEKEADFYAKSDGRQFAMIPYEVELLDPEAPQHHGDWRSVAPFGGVSLDWAHLYWSGALQPVHQSGAMCREVIAATRLRILRRF